MVRFFIGQAVTGEDVEKLQVELKKIYEVLECRDIDSYDTLRENQEEFEGNNTKLEIMEHAFKEIDKSDAFFAIVRSDRKSEGMLMEVGYCLANKKKIILAIKKDVDNTYLRDLAEKIIEYEDSEDLIKQLAEVDL